MPKHAGILRILCDLAIGGEDSDGFLVRLYLRNGATVEGHLYATGDDYVELAFKNDPFLGNACAQFDNAEIIGAAWAGC